MIEQIVTDNNEIKECQMTQSIAIQSIKHKVQSLTTTNKLVSSLRTEMLSLIGNKYDLKNYSIMQQQTQLSKTAEK